MRTALVLAAAVFLAAQSALAEPYKVGSEIPAIELPDQHGEARTLDDKLRAIVFSRDMDAGDLVKQAIEQAGPDLFDRNDAVYVVDTKGMPAIIRALFAMPAMRRRPYRLLVDDDGAKTADIPGGATYPTVLVVEKLTVRAVRFPTTADELIAALEPPSVPPIKSEPEPEAK